MRNFCKNLFKFILILGVFWGCEKSESNTLSISQNKIELQSDSTLVSVTITTDAESWNITNPASGWLSLSSTCGKSGSSTITIKAKEKTGLTRTDTLVLTAGDATPVQIIVTQLSSEYVYTQSINVSTLTFNKSGNSSDITITSSAPKWKISSNVDWLTFSVDSGNAGSKVLKITALQNTGSEARNATITLSAQYTPSVTVAITQKGDLYPSYNTSPIAPDATGMTSTAVEIAAKMTLGWNIGNTLEAIGGETAWGNPRVSNELIKLVKQNGFNAIRIPCSWNQYMANSSTAQISESWLSRVKQVVQYCVDNDMYVILNIHWDGGWLENNCTATQQENNNAKQKAFWEQIATNMRDFDEHLIFASANEPAVENAAQMAVLTSYHQTFINAVRSTGGKNTYRVLAIQGPSTDIEKTNKLMISLPTDPTPDKLMVEVHCYTPSTFCILTEDASWGKMAYYWGKDYHSTTDTEHNATWGEETTITQNFKLMSYKFVTKGIPVIIGEFGAVRRSSLTGDALTLHLASRAYYLKYVTQQARAYGITPFYWDAGGMDNNGSAIFNRKTNTVFDQQALEALQQGASK
jgi:aryl-phospho-beta-D-glucosidase BglC (GH1 family)